MLERENPRGKLEDFVTLRCIFQPIYRRLDQWYRPSYNIMPISAGLNPHHAPRDTSHIADLRPLPPTLVMLCYYSKNLNYQLMHILHDCFI